MKNSMICGKIKPKKNKLEKKKYKKKRNALTHFKLLCKNNKL